MIKSALDQVFWWILINPWPMRTFLGQLMSLLVLLKESGAIWWSFWTYLRCLREAQGLVGWQEGQIQGVDPDPPETLGSNLPHNVHQLDLTFLRPPSPLVFRYVPRHNLDTPNHFNSTSRGVNPPQKILDGNGIIGTHTLKSWNQF